MDLTTFDYFGNTVRTTAIDGEPHFVLADLCEVLGIANPRNVAARLDHDEKGVHPMDTPGGRQNVTVVTEAGMYSVIVRSDSPNAGTFRRWVTHEVLPQIRRTGSYVQREAAQITRADLARMVIEAETELAAERERVAVLEPRAAVADHILDATGDLSVADTAKAIARSGVAIGATRLFKHLADLGWIFRGRDGRWHIMQSALETGRLAALPQSHYHPATGELVTDPPQVRVTPKGLAFLVHQLTSQRDRHLEVV